MGQGAEPLSHVPLPRLVHTGDALPRGFCFTFFLVLWVGEGGRWPFQSVTTSHRWLFNINLNFNLKSRKIKNAVLDCGSHISRPPLPPVARGSLIGLCR